VDGDRSAVLLLRVWLADGARTFRGRLTKVDTSVARDGEETSVAVVSSPRDAAEVVRTWLNRFLDEAPDRIDSDEEPATRPPEPRRGPGPNVH
jgi:hypothetical protein